MFRDRNVNRICKMKINLLFEMVSIMHCFFFFLKILSLTFLLCSSVFRRPSNYLPSFLFHSLGLRRYFPREIGWPNLAENNTRHMVEFEFQICNNLFIVLLTICSTQYLGHAYIKKLVFSSLKFTFNWAFCTFSGNPMGKECNMLMSCTQGPCVLGRELAGHLLRYQDTKIIFPTPHYILLFNIPTMAC